MKTKTIQHMLVLAVFLVIAIASVFALPSGPSIVNMIKNETKSGAGTMVNGSGGTGSTAGGYIFVMNMSASTQNVRWKAYVGNVTGKLVLEDASSSVIYDWSLSTITGEIYATRASSTPTWSSVVCANRSHIGSEEEVMQHTNQNDNITTTFWKQADHPAFSVGTSDISANTCNTTNTYVNNASDSAEFDEMILYDGTNTIYTTILESDQTGYSGQPYDFQILIPENGSSAWDSSTAYYFYVELS
jgi:hypothetical protein